MSTARIVTSTYDDDLPVDPGALDYVSAARGYANQSKDHRDIAAAKAAEAQTTVDGFQAVATQAQEDVGDQVAAAGAHVTAAQAQATAASASAALAQGWADAAEDTNVPGAGNGTRSAKHHAAKAGADRTAVAADRAAVATDRVAIEATAASIAGPLIEVTTAITNIAARHIEMLDA